MAGVDALEEEHMNKVCLEWSIMVIPSLPSILISLDVPEDTPLTVLFIAINRAIVQKFV